MIDAEKMKNAAIFGHNMRDKLEGSGDKIFLAMLCKRLLKILNTSRCYIRLGAVGEKLSMRAE